MFKGIDVSAHQGRIDWEKVKNSGIQFAILRLGIGSDIASQDDAYFAANVQGCESVGLPWGAYLYSYALNLEDAKSEVQHALRLLNGKRPEYPVFFDMEDADGYKAKHDVCPRRYSEGFRYERARIHREYHSGERIFRPTQVDFSCYWSAQLINLLGSTHTVSITQKCLAGNAFPAVLVSFKIREILRVDDFSYSLLADLTDTGTEVQTTVTPKDYLGGKIDPITIKYYKINPDDTETEGIGPPTNVSKYGFLVYIRKSDDYIAAVCLPCRS